MGQRSFAQHMPLADLARGEAADKNHVPVRLAPTALTIERRSDATLVLRSAIPLPEPVRCVTDWLAQWKERAPDRCFLAERQQGQWTRLSYAESLAQVERIASGLLGLGLTGDTPLLILSENSVEHALLALAAMHVGIPVAPVSPAYALLSQDHQKLRQITAALQPGAVYVSDPDKYAHALRAIGMTALDTVAVRRGVPGADVECAHRRVGPDTVAKILFTSGSTGSPKGVINTQRMLTVNQMQSLQVWPFLADMPPVLLDWLPWNHTFGGNYNLHMVLSNGGTLYIDAGKPVPGLFDASLNNLRDVEPTVYCNVPRGFDLLLPQLEQDTALRSHFFRHCRFFFYAGAALPQNIWDRFQALAREETGHNATLVSSWGSTETAPLCAAVHFPIDHTGVIGLPVPGCELKLLPNQGKLEARVRGPHVTPGYWREPALTQAAFDEEGFYRMGDALRFNNPAQPEEGLVFDGRTAENFKLNTGTWVHVGELRMAMVAACNPLIQDAVVTGHDRDEIGVLLFLHPSAAEVPATEVRQKVAQALLAMNQGAAGSSARVARALVLNQGPRLDLGEITDKGYVNQRMVLTLRAAAVQQLYDDNVSDVILPSGTPSKQKAITP